MFGVFVQDERKGSCDETVYRFRSVGGGAVYGL